MTLSGESDSDVDDRTDIYILGTAIEDLSPICERCGRPISIDRAVAINPTMFRAHYICTRCAYAPEGGDAS